MDEMKLILGELQKINTRLDKIEERLDRLETRLDKVEDRLDRLETRLDKVEDRLGKLETRLGKVEDRLDKVESIAQATFDQVVRNTEAITELSARLNPIETATKSNCFDITVLKEKIAR